MNTCVEREAKQYYPAPCCICQNNRCLLFVHTPRETGGSHGNPPPSTKSTVLPQQEFCPIHPPPTVCVHISSGVAHLVTSHQVSMQQCCLLAAELCPLHTLPTMNTILNHKTLKLHYLQTCWASRLELSTPPMVYTHQTIVWFSQVTELLPLALHGPTVNESQTENHEPNQLHSCTLDL